MAVIIKRVRVTPNASDESVYSSIVARCARLSNHLDRALVLMDRGELDGAKELILRVKQQVDWSRDNEQEPQ
jgi:hypothetical protein